MRAIITIIVAMALISGCTTVAKYSIRDNLIDIGIPENKADCMADQLEERLDSDDLQELARYMSGLSRADTPGEALDELLKVDNPQAVGAITASGISCLFAPR
jgi:uncharacterized protein YceK